MFDDISLFINLVDAGSYARLAKKLGMHQSTISRRIEQLEADISFKIIKHIVYGGIELTEEGSLLYKSTMAKFADINSAIEQIRAQNEDLHGDFKIVIPAFVHMFVGPVINKFLLRYPDVNFHISNYNSDVSSYSEHFDIVISLVLPRNQNYIISVLYNTVYSYYATPEYLERNGEPTLLQDLENHEAIIPTIDNIPLLNWQAFNRTSGELEVVNVRHVTASYDGSIGGKFLTLAHRGVCSLPDMMVWQEVVDKKLVKILTNYAIPEVKLYILKTDNNFNAKSAAFLKFLKQSIPEILEMDNKW